MKTLFHETVTQPASTLAKTKLARRLYEELKALRDAKDTANWAEGEALYLIDRFGLHNYVFGTTKTKGDFYREVDIPVSTALFKITIYEFYVVRHGFTLADLTEANTKKLHRAIPYLQKAGKRKVKQVVDLAEREKQSLGDFLVSVGAPERWCVHAEQGKVEVTQCKQCKRILNKTAGSTQARTPSRRSR